ncbi:transposase [Streptomyces sp. NPDC087512]|uniref:transposase n=1 Tax=Streptomyces sp. NPDC087512 TaxID=3155059 RepID=UPI00343F3563
MGRPPVRPRRQLTDGIRFRVRTGVPWRDVPVEYGPWSRVYDLFRRWRGNRRPVCSSSPEITGREGRAAGHRQVAPGGRAGPEAHARNREKLGSRVAGHPSSTPGTTRLGMPSSAASTASKGTGLWSRETTSSRAATRPLSS